MTAASVPGAFRRSFWLPIRVGVALWIIDLFLLLVDDPRPWLPTLFGALSGLLSVLFVCAALGVLFGALSYIATLPAPQGLSAPRLSWLSRLRPYLASDDSEEALLRSGLLLSVPALIALYVGASIWLIMRFVVGMARPDFTALAIVAAQAVMVPVVLLLHRPAHNLGTWLALLLRRIPGVGRRLFGTPRHFAAWLLTCSFLALSVFALRFREPLSFLPWSEITAVSLAVLLVAGWTHLLGHAPHRALLGFRVVASLTVLGAVVCGAFLGPHQLFARRVAEERLFSGRMGFSALRTALDFDGDGSPWLIGGGDCAPFDPHIAPTAMEIPDNGIDENCDGKDLIGTSPALAGSFHAPVPKDVPSRPNIVLITVDVFSPIRLKPFGATRTLMPKLDAYIKRSALFRSCFAQGPSTRLSFPSMFTSRWDSQIHRKLEGRHPFPIGNAEQTLAEVLRDAGYDTAAIVPDALFGPARWRGLTQGFNRVVEWPYTRLPKVPHNGARIREATTVEMRRPRKGPLFVWAHFIDAHGPHVQPPGLPVFGPSDEDRYDAELLYLDEQLSLLLAEVERTYGDNALVIITGDHGRGFDKARHAKTHYGSDLTTAVLHVPLIISGSLIPPRSLPGVVSTMDIAPTIANLLRLPGPLPFEGTSLVPELMDGTRSRPGQLMHQLYLHERLWRDQDPLDKVSLRTDQYNLVHDRTKGRFELYEWPKDYLETRELSGEAAHAAAYAELKDQLARMTYRTHKWQKKEAPAPAAPLKIQ